MATKLSKVAARTAEELVVHFELEEASRPLLRPGMTPAQFLDALVAKERFADAVRLLAHGLGRREAVWWACVCVRSVVSPRTPRPAVAALEAAEKWAYQPSEPCRWAAQAASDAESDGHPAKFAAMGAYFAGESLTQPMAVPRGVQPPPPVPPGPFLTAKAVAGAVICAAVAEKPEAAPERYRRFLAQGTDIANGGTGQAAKPS